MSDCFSGTQESGPEQNCGIVLSFSQGEIFYEAPTLCWNNGIRQQLFQII